MLTRWMKVWCVSLVSFLVGCSSPLNTTIEPVKTNVSAEKIAAQTVVRDMNTVAIFPLADYSREQSFLQNPRYGINLKIMEAITDQFVSRGVTVLNQEDVNGFLVKEGVIALMKNKGADVSTPQWELMNQPHEGVQQANIAHIMSQDTTGDFSDNKTMDGVKVGLSKGKIREIGGNLGVDKIVRGQIIEYGFGETKSLNPANGWLAVLVGGLAEGAGAFVYQQGYEKGLPDTSWTSKYIYTNEMGQGPGANIPPKQTNCFVQLRLYLQDVKTGKIEWSNRTEIKFAPTSLLNYDENQPKNMTDKSIEKGVGLLMGDLFKGNLVKKGAADDQVSAERAALEVK